MWQNDQIKKKRERVMIVCVSAACFVVCWLPYFILFQVVTLCTECVSQQIMTTAIWLGYINRSTLHLSYCICQPLFFFCAFSTLLLPSSPSPATLSTSLLPRWSNDFASTLQKRSTFHYQNSTTNQIYFSKMFLSFKYLYV